MYPGYYSNGHQPVTGLTNEKGAAKLNKPGYNYKLKHMTLFSPPVL